MHLFLYCLCFLFVMFIFCFIYLPYDCLPYPVVHYSMVLLWIYKFVSVSLSKMMLSLWQHLHHDCLGIPLYPVPLGYILTHSYDIYSDTSLKNAVKYTLFHQHNVIDWWLQKSLWCSFPLHAVTTNGLDIEEWRCCHRVSTVLDESRNRVWMVAPDSKHFSVSFFLILVNGLQPKQPHTGLSLLSCTPKMASAMASTASLCPCVIPTPWWPTLGSP